MGNELKRSATVLYFNREKSHGWLKVDGYPSDIYVHISELRMAEIDCDLLLKGSTVLCHVGMRNDRPCATNLEIVGYAQVP